MSFLVPQSAQKVDFTDCYKASRLLEQNFLTAAGNYYDKASKAESIIIKRI